MATHQHSVPVIRYQYLQPVQIVHVTNRHVSVLIKSVEMLVWCLCGVHTAAPSTPNFTTATLGRRGLNVTWWPQDGVVYSSGTTFTVHYRRLGIILRPPSRLPASRSPPRAPIDDSNCAILLPRDPRGVRQNYCRDAIRKQRSIRAYDSLGIIL